MLALETGEIDYISIYGLPPSAVPGLSKKSDVSVVTHRTRVNYGGIMAHMNLRNQYLQSKEVRQAIYYAIDRDAARRTRRGGLGRTRRRARSRRSTSPGSIRRSPRSYPYDPKKAEALLDQAGFKRGADGKRFSVRISYARTDQGGALHSAAEIMREQLRDVGIDLVLEPKDYAVWMEGAHLKWDFDMSMGSYQTGPDPAIAVVAALHHQEHPEADGPQPDGLFLGQGRRAVRRGRARDRSAKSASRCIIRSRRS